jgi:glycogen phosphorylase
MNRGSLSQEETSSLIIRLRRLAGNLWWTWNQDCQDIFHELSPRGWQTLYHNAIAVLQEVSDYELGVRLQDRRFATRVRTALNAFEAYLNDTNTWGRRNAPALLAHPVAYLTAEFGFHETLPIAAGGLGILAGDHTRSASDLGIGFVGVSLFYREGYFQQAFNQDNWQTEYYTLLNPKLLPMELVLTDDGTPLLCSVEIDLSRVYFQAWRVNVGRCRVYLIDSDLPQNEQHYRNLTLHVYGGDNTTRIMQEMLLGIGGVRLMRALGIQPSLFHINEGHVAFLAVELIREKVAQGMSFDEALAATRTQCHFTTHTPVAAGHDRFSPHLMRFAFHDILAGPGPRHQDLLALGRVNPQDEHETFCMTVLALKASRTANAVSELHGQVSRKMWHSLYPGNSADQVPIGHITNGIHLVDWMKGPVRSFWKRKLGAHWDKEIYSREFWQRMLDPDFVTDEELLALRYMLRRALIEYARRRFPHPSTHRPQDEFIHLDPLLRADTLTIGFARRFATYKRAPLIFQDFDAIANMALDPERPIQFIFAGKAHPRDTEGKRYIQHIINLSKNSVLRNHLVFLDNYDVHVARQMVSGCDVWLNTPRRPFEASGTSGQKIGCNGGLNLSIMDGWFREGYDGTNGFAIGCDSHPDSIQEQDRLDSENLLHVLRDQVIPCFYERDSQGIPRRWLQTIRRSMATMVPQFTTWRMVQEYTLRYYLPRE